MSSTSLIHLSELLGNLYAHHKDKEDAFKEACERRACALVLKGDEVNLVRIRLACGLASELDDKFKLASPNDTNLPDRVLLRVQRMVAVRKRVLELASQGKMDISEVGRRRDDRAYHLMLEHCGVAKGQLCEERLKQQGKRYFEPTLFEYVEQQFYRRMPITKPQFHEMCVGFSRNALTSGNKHTAKIDELHRAGFTEQLLGEIWKRYPGDAKLLKLPKPGGDGPTEDLQASEDSTGKAPRAAHSQDFRSVQWYGVAYSFTKQQAAIIKILWDAWEAGTPDVGNDYLLEAIAGGKRLVDAFRDNSAWNTMIKDGATKGSKRLAIPENS